jgi:peptidylprolyl isomerase
MNPKITKILFIFAALIFVMFATGCIGTEDKIAKVNDTVNVFYTLMLEDGSVYQTNFGQKPLSFVLGSGQVIKGFDNAIVGMKLRETKTFILTPDQAYGTYSYDTYADIPISLAEIYNNGPISVGSIFPMYDYSTGAIQMMQGEIMIIDRESGMTRVVTNPPLAGKTLTFDIMLDSISEGTR